MEWMESDRTPSLIDRDFGDVSVKHFPVTLGRCRSHGANAGIFLRDDNRTNFEAPVIQGSGVREQVAGGIGVQTEQ